MKQESPPTLIDVKAFAHAAGELSGQDSLSKYERLMQEAQGLGGDRALNWSARGEIRVDEADVEQIWLHVSVDVALPLTCQRCLGPVDIALAVSRSFRFVGTEEAAEAQDEEAEEDVLALSPDFNLADLIEDEVLMGLPVVPKHDSCPVDVKLAAEDAGFEVASAEKRHPFAVLAKLQGRQAD
ncbi:MAG: hypothetical protein ACI9I0_000270 [Rhodoferax sp.]|jgi:uncharacterized protein